MAAAAYVLGELASEEDRATLLSLAEGRTPLSRQMARGRASHDMPTAPDKAEAEGDDRGAGERGLRRGGRRRARARRRPRKGVRARAGSAALIALAGHSKEAGPPLPAPPRRAVDDVGRTWRRSWRGSSRPASARRGEERRARSPFSGGRSSEPGWLRAGDVGDRAGRRGGRARSRGTGRSSRSSAPRRGARPRTRRPARSRARPGARSSVPFAQDPDAPSMRASVLVLLARSSSPAATRDRRPGARGSGTRSVQRTALASVGGSERTRRSGARSPSRRAGPSRRDEGYASLARAGDGAAGERRGARGRQERIAPGGGRPRRLMPWSARQRSGRFASFGRRASAAAACARWRSRSATRSRACARLRSAVCPGAMTGGRALLPSPCRSSPCALQPLGCSDVTRFTSSGDHYQGSVIAGDFVRAGLGSVKRSLCLVLDASHLQDPPGSIDVERRTLRAPRPLRPDPSALRMIRSRRSPSARGASRTSSTSPPRWRTPTRWETSSPSCRSCSQVGSRCASFAELPCRSTPGRRREQPLRRGSR